MVLNLEGGSLGFFYMVLNSRYPLEGFLDCVDNYKQQQTILNIPMLKPKCQ